MSSPTTYDVPRALAHAAAAKRELVAVERSVDWEPPSIFRSVLTEFELTEAEAELKALQRHAFEIVHQEPRE
jgi:hypothetical protein